MKPNDYIFNVGDEVITVSSKILWKNTIGKED